MKKTSSRRKIGLMAAGVVAAATAAVLTPAAAYADGGCDASYFCVYSDDCAQTGRWVGDAGTWGTCWSNHEDWAGNSGNPGAFSDVDLFWGSNFTGAYACLPRGNSWNLRDNQEWFTWIRNASGWAGHGEVVHDNAAGHHWATGCGNNNF